MPFDPICNWRRHVQERVKGTISPQRGHGTYLSPFNRDPPAPAHFRIQVWLIIPVLSFTFDVSHSNQQRTTTRYTPPAPPSLPSPPPLLPLLSLPPLGPFFQSISAIDSSNLSIADINNVLGTNEPGFSPTLAVGARSIVDDAFNSIFGFFGINDNEITRRLSSPFNSTVLQPIWTFDLDALMADRQNFQRDVANRSLDSLD
ncbi:hypothetical protein EDB83DRAFT_2568112 [Lactarius deliciosus]|nr:hypothetical protein EDB83DRAFT_2568112 [Lactarius deliciosus]